MADHTDPMKIAIEALKNIQMAAYAHEFTEGTDFIYSEAGQALKDIEAALTASAAAQVEAERDSAFMREKAEKTRTELQRIKDAPEDAEDHAVKREILDKMSDPKCWEDGVAVITGYGVQEFVKGFRAALPTAQQARQEPVCEAGFVRTIHRWFKDVPGGTMLYAAPPQAEAQQSNTAGQAGNEGRGK